MEFKNNLIKESFNLKTLHKKGVYRGDFEKLISINPEWLRYFYVLCKIKSYSEAASLLNITPQALSKAITGIENQLGLHLILRSRNYKGLTQNGSIFFEKIKIII